MTNAQQQSAPQNQQSSSQTTTDQIQETLNKLKTGQMKFIC